MRNQALFALAGGLVAVGLLTAGPAVADDAQTAMSSRHGDDMQHDRSMPRTQENAMEPREQLGQKTYKERINTVARGPLRHDLDYIDSRDRWSWHGHTQWQGIRDKRPIIARKTLGFHDPRPHVPRHERVMRVSRGPIRGTAGQQ